MVRPLAGFETVILTPGTRAPDASFTVPTMVASCCAGNRTATAINKQQANVMYRIFIKHPSKATLTRLSHDKGYRPEKRILVSAESGATFPAGFCSKGLSLDYHG